MPSGPTGLSKSALVAAGATDGSYAIVIIPVDPLVIEVIFLLPANAVLSSAVAPKRAQEPASVQAISVGPLLWNVSVIAVFNAEDNVKPSETFALIV